MKPIIEVEKRAMNKKLFYPKNKFSRLLLEICKRKAFTEKEIEKLKEFFEIKDLAQDF